MESSSPHTGVTMLKQTSRRLTSSIQLQDLWSAIRDGSITDLEPALLALKKNGGNIDIRNTFGSTALHIAVWRNHVPIVRRLLAAGADPDARDGESGWSSLHRALHFGHLAVAGVLIEAGASLTLEDSKGRTPVDLLSGPVQQVFETNNEGATEFYSWGNGANYQLGTGNSRIQKFPCKVEAFQGLFVKAIAAAKFHSVAVTALGELYTWGYGRGGRLGHPDFDIHSGQAAVITPRQLIFGLGQRRVKVIAAAKHHTIVATQGGEVFTWGSNREGQLGYTAVDTQPTPRRVSFLKTRVIAVAAANKHSAAVTEPGEIYTWGCNREAQLGYGTSNSASNYVPRAVEALKGKCFMAVSAAKYHTVALGSDGEVFTWGYKMVTPRRVTISRNIKKSGNIPLKFHRMERLHVTAIAAGMTHSTALSDDGSLFYWVSSDLNLRCQQLYSMTTSNVVSVSSGKYWTTIVTSTGDVYAWDGKEDKEGFPMPQRVHGIKRAISASVGENHFLAVSAVYIPEYPPKCIRDIQMPRKEQYEETDDIEDDNMTSDYQNDIKDTGLENEMHEKCVPSLKDLCQKVAAEYLLEPRTSLQLLDVADTLGAEELRMHSEDLVLRNLDYILTISPAALANVSTELLSKLENSLDSKSSEPWSYRCLPTPTATFPAVIDSEEDDKIEFSRLRNIASPDTTDLAIGERRSGEGFLQRSSASNIALAKQTRAIRKKLQQIEMLEMKQRNDHSLDHQQLAKLQTKPSLENALHSLESGIAIGHDEETKLASIKANSLEDKSIVRNGLGSHRHKGKKKNNKFQQVQIEHLPETSKGDMLNKAGLKEKQDELHSKKGFNNDHSGFYNKEEEHITIGVSNISSSIQKANQVASSSHGSDNKERVETFLVHDSELKVTPKSNQFLQKSSKKRSKKGGLSVFLSGALDEAPKVPEAALVPPKVEGPAWGGAKIIKDPMSLLEIQNQQIVETNIPSTSEHNKSSSKCLSKDKHSDCKVMRRSRGLAEAYEMDVDEIETNHIHIPTNKLIRPSAPIAVNQGKGTGASDTEKSTPPWAGTSPLMSRSSLREIQMQQVKHQSPKSKNLSVAGGSGFTIDRSQNTVTDSPNRWFKPEVSSPSSIRNIQIEEKAMKELRRFYKNVKLVKEIP
ncbi:hypothetical protein SUGI_0661090 [Cryptomeria japonica]|uniref:uncharacterized protein LOC131033198 n=1 Tax=Cryptomeria japonica TaxID=3369 RepID=UPI002414CBD1|nr:uncharacterized protein LOC131033198 [Cryptomeria japonica]XP_057820333.2 uncharacterized protein LOC131033198 [Cryptomeria japonica]XP_057820334.2 uncharacterized protein LOC131033198 [Cryptomeria japonica]XP_057820336.2 uncharacterized protein LOC131033198 [Cryptomeria japonica]GLJ32823.1 hypothetical protein SUGI_0661090 [Cryptomeria japonica]